MVRKEGCCLLGLGLDTNHAFKLDARLARQYTFHQRLGICRESCVVRKGIHGEALIVVREEYTDQFGNAAITAHGRANVRKRHLTAKISHHPGNAGVLLVHSILVGDVPDVQAEVLQVAELDAGSVLCVDLNDIIQERGLLAGR